MTIRVDVNIRSRIAPGAAERMARQLVVPAVTSATRTVADYAKDEITSAGRVDTGQMRNANTPEVSVSGRGVRGRVTNRAPHAKFQHDGTTGPIVPRFARVLRFQPKGGGAFVFARQVRGVTGVPFLRNALRRLRREDFRR